MSLKKVAFKVGPEDAGARLDQFLALHLPAALKTPGKPENETLSKAKMRKLILAGAVYLNGRRVRIASKELLPGARVEAFVDLAKLFETGGPAKDLPFEMTQDRILFEDEWLIAVDKPAGLPTQPTLDEARNNLFGALKKFLSKREGSGEAYLGLHHRLDRDTSGVILFTKRKEANAGVGELFQSHQAVKVYQALTLSPSGKNPPDTWSVKNYLGRGGSGGKSSGKRSRFQSVRSGGDFAHTDFRVLERLKDGLWVEAKPKTGRTHQIRVHLSEGGMPIRGDTLYGASEKSATRLMLHAVSLTFPHPIHRNEISIQSGLPEDFLKCLQLCRQRSRPDTGPSACGAS